MHQLRKALQLIDERRTEDEMSSIIRDLVEAIKGLSDSNTETEAEEIME